MNEKTTKQFSTLGVMGVATGIVLEPKGFTTIHEVMDHLFPGIMTLGCAFMAEAAQNEIKRQHPNAAAFIAGFDGDVGENWFKFAAGALKVFGDTMPVEGPMEASPVGTILAASNPQKGGAA